MVYFVGAGCGAADLITVRGKNLLEKADVIIYAGSLVNPELLTYAKDDCEIHNSAYMTLEEVIEVMKPNGENHVVTVQKIFNEEGEEMESAPHPKQVLYIDLGEKLELYDILRRKEEE